MLTFSNRSLLLPALGVTLLLAGGLTGCASQQKTGATVTAKAPGHAVAGAIPAKMPACALAIPGTTFTTHNIDGGIAVDFKNPGATNAVRQRMTSRMAYGKAHPKPMPMKMTKTLETIPEGVRLLIRPADAANVDKVRAMVPKMLAERKAKIDAARSADTAKPVDGTKPADEAAKAPAAPAATK